MFVNAMVRGERVWDRSNSTIVDRTSSLRGKGGEGVRKGVEENHNMSL